MNNIRALLCLAATIVLTGCPKPPEPTVTRLDFWEKTDCELVYRSDVAQVVENFCGTQWKPVKLYIQDQKYSLDWIDRRASQRLFDEGCLQPSDCFYELKMEGLTINGRFAYVAGVVKGEYTFEVDANENARRLTQTLAGTNKNAG